MKSVAIYPYKEDPFIRSLRVQTWFRAVSEASGLSPRELERLFGGSAGTAAKRSCIWNKYRRGEVLPRGGKLRGGNAGLVERVEHQYPGTAKWLTLPLWRVADRAPMEMSEIRRCYESLPPMMRSIFIHQNATISSLFWRRDFKSKSACDVLLRLADPDGLTAVLTMRKEAESAQNHQQHDDSTKAALEYVRRLASHQVIGEPAGTLGAYLMRQRTAVHVPK